MSTLKDCIDLIAADRPRWSKEDQETAHRAWKVVFQDVPSDVIEEAAKRFLKRGRGIPTAQKLTKIMDTIKQERANAQRALTEPVFDDVSVVEAERRRIQEDLERDGDPIADWLERHGQPTWRSKNRQDTPSPAPDHGSVADLFT